MVLVTDPKPAPTLHEKKRHGGHHRPSKHYHKTYWPYLTMFAVLALVFVGNSLWTPTRQVLGYASDISQSNLLQSSNMARTGSSESPLILNDKLAAAAQAKADDMAKRNYWSHITPEGNLPRHFVEKAGYAYGAIGENLAYGFDGSAATVNAWLGSAEHRANVLDKNYKEVGFGIANAKNFQGADNATIVVALYGTPNTTGLRGMTVDGSETGVLPMRTISRIETISTANATLIAIVCAFVAAGAAMFITLKHARIFKKALIHGEHFIVRNHLLDLAFLFVGGIGFVITRNAGIIH